MKFQFVLIREGARGEVRLFDMVTAKTILTVEDLHLGTRSSFS